MGRSDNDKDAEEELRKTKLEIEQLKLEKMRAERPADASSFTEYVRKAPPPTEVERDDLIAKVNKQMNGLFNRKWAEYVSLKCDACTEKYEAAMTKTDGAVG